MALMLRVAVAAAAAATAGRVERVEHAESAMVLVPGGSFVMGLPVSETHLEAHEESEQDNLRAACAAQLGDLAEDYCRDEYIVLIAQPSRRVFVAPFEIDRYEVTVAAYRACAAAGGCDVAALVAGDTRYAEDAALPMVNVTWQDAADYCAWTGKRLPTEAEWEKAARGTDGRRWPWGNHERADGANHGAVDTELMRGRAWGAAQFIADASDGHEHAVAPGTMQWSDSPYGVYDLAGNVSEWVADYYAAGYASCDESDAAAHRSPFARAMAETCVERSDIDPVVDAPPVGTTSMRVYRGGSWAEPKLFGRTYFRQYADPKQRAFDRGFRCARDAADPD